jgi:Sec-independent protein secretion pathway component TatC
MGVVAVPWLLLYEGGIVVSRLFARTPPRALSEP